VRVRVIFLGEDPRDALQQAAADYLARAGRRLDAGLVPLAPARRGKGAERAGDDEKIRLLEADALLKASEGTTRIALDAQGTLHGSSVELSRELEELLARGRPLSFLIGGATGLHPKVRQESQRTWSLSRLTYAHRLAVLVLAEQIYRAAEIARGGPYHK
jgi:23S rRNA (pseudouridine1915-N3)-methyltransferase